MMKPIVLITVVILMLGCSSTPTSTGVVLDLFDIEAYLEKEFDGVDQRAITKTISYNDDKEIIKIANYDLKEDINILGKVNINNPSWGDKYVVDTMDLSNGRVDLIYTSIDPKLQTKRLTISKDKNEVLGFEAHQERDALISSSSKIITYTSEEGYRIATTSKNLISPERTIAIDVRF